MKSLGRIATALSAVAGVLLVAAIWTAPMTQALAATGALALFVALIFGLASIG